MLIAKVDKIIELRKAHGLNQKRLSEKAGLPVNAVADLLIRFSNILPYLLCVLLALIYFFVFFLFYPLFLHTLSLLSCSKRYLQQRAMVIDIIFYFLYLQCVFLIIFNNATSIVIPRNPRLTSSYSCTLFS